MPSSLRQISTTAELGSIERQFLCDRCRALREHLDGRVTEDIIRRKCGQIRRYSQGGQSVYPFPFGPQRFAAGGQNNDVARRSQNPLYDPRRCGNDMLAAVEHNQEMLVPEPGWQLGDWVNA